MLKTIIMALAIILSATIVTLPELYDIYVIEFVGFEDEEEEELWFEYRYGKL